MRLSLIILLCLTYLGSAAASTAPTTSPTTAPTTVPSAGRNVVLWINLDGVRGDYIDRAKPPTLTKLMNDGAYSRELVPVFPSLTFPSHATLATGVTVSGHGIPGNSYYDTEDGETYSFPADYKFLRAEAIWETATRQGIRVSVVDWPLSHRQTGEHKSAFFGPYFDGSLSDEQRLQMAITPMMLDNGSPPLQLIMGYASKIDTVGHSKGPDAEETLAELNRVDEVLADVIKQAQRRFDTQMEENDNLYVIITTDHGMSKVETNVNVDRMLGPTWSKEITTVTSSSLAIIYLDKLPETERTARRDAIIEHVKQYDFVNAFTREQAREKYGFDDPSRVGELILSLDKSYTFNRSQKVEVMTPVSKGSGLGMHGYDPAENSEMLGFMVIWRYRGSLGGIDLGRVDSKQLHPTVARLLGIEPAKGVTAEA
ncbi:MAG TPA: alkaline phosphatase family protein, partial [Tepidisphaeraceae bacterium]|nr:alkaline phosphatase family protein [Tepidisphaeraceae bacterium]